METDKKRREFLKSIGAMAGGFVLAPVAISCGTTSGIGQAASTTPQTPSLPNATPVDPSSLPDSMPQSWDPIAFNKTRGNLGAIPESYWPDINGPDGPAQHLGKHLPYFPVLGKDVVPPGYLALMWGDPGQGYTKHPNSPKGTEAYPNGHWYDWVKVRKAVDGPAVEVVSSFGDWPTGLPSDNGRFMVQGPGAITDDTGKSTIYLVALPSDLTPGDTIRIYAHCLYHGEYVDFLTLPT